MRIQVDVEFLLLNQDEDMSFDGMRRSPAVNPPVLHGKGFGKTGGVERVENL